MRYDSERCADLAAAVAELARREAAYSPAAAAWIDQVRQDLIDQAPPALADQWADAPAPAELLRLEYHRLARGGTDLRSAMARLGGKASTARRWWREAA